MDSETSHPANPNYKKGQSIDAVITWVDGSDPKLAQKRRETLAKYGSVINQPVNSSTEVPVSEVATGRDTTRFIDNNELFFCIRSIRTFAPWVRRIFVVTDDQTPSFITPEYQKENRVQIIDHREIFSSYEWALPTFNTRTIETALWRIPGLAPRFIYFNDDFMLTQPLTPEDFFTESSVVIRGRWNRIIQYGPIRMKASDLLTWFARRFLGITRTMHLLLQMYSAKLAGCKKRYFRVPHVPHPVQTKTLQNFFEQNPDLFEQNIRYRIRNTAQFSAIFLAHHLEIMNENAVLERANNQLMLNGEMDRPRSLRSKLRQLESGNIKFACLHAFDQFSKNEQSEIKKTINGMFEREECEHKRHSP